MIYTSVKVTIKNQQASINRTIVLYRGDKNVEIQFEILKGLYRQYKNENNSLIEDLDASYGQLVIAKPNSSYVFSDITPTKDGKIVFVIPEEMVNEVVEVGLYTFQIRLYDATQESRVTLPPVIDGIEIKEPIASEDNM